MLAIQLFLVVAFGVLTVTFLKRRNTMRHQAGKKLLFLAFIVASVVTILSPSLASRAAQLVGVGRGTDLLLYLLVAAFCFVCVNVYLKFKDLEARIVRLARRTAIAEALAVTSLHEDGDG